MRYVYELNGHRIEAEFPIGTAPKIYKGHRRVLTPPAIQFKGDGWTKSAEPARSDG